MFPTSARRVGLMAAMLLVGGGPLLAGQDAENPHTSLDDVQAGERLFRAHCGRCHARDASGDDGPSLRDGGFWLAQSDAGLFRVITDGVPNTRMPPIFRRRTDETVWQIVAYLRAINQRPENVSLPGDPAAGARLFTGAGECAACHMVNGAGGLHGPDLTAAGDRRSPDELMADLVEPNDEVGPRWWSVRVTYADGQILEGLRLNEDTYSFRLLDADANLWSVVKRDLRDAQRIESSTMPSYANRLTAPQLDDLVAYLYSLRGEDRWY